jgi:hypothetical protein
MPRHCSASQAQQQRAQYLCLSYSRTVLLRIRRSQAAQADRERGLRELVVLRRCRWSQLRCLAKLYHQWATLEGPEGELELHCAGHCV